MFFFTNRVIFFSFLTPKRRIHSSKKVTLISFAPLQKNVRRLFIYEVFWHCPKFIYSSINRENDGDLESDVNPLEAPKGNYVIVEEEDVVVLNRDTFAHYVKPKVNPYMKVIGCLSVCTEGFREPLYMEAPPRFCEGL